MPSEQFRQEVFGLTEPEGPVLIFVDDRYQAYANDPERAAFLRKNPDILQYLCRRIDDGNDPCVLPMKDGCTAGTQLADERGHCGYFLIFLPGYTRQTAQANMDLIELILAQAQLIFCLIEKNSRFCGCQTSISNLISPEKTANCL
ncbi:MAG TPA: hypothetical protein PK052_01955 [Anaerohalosphaeraceae bacterium]|nr:hypothetical protein [Phycisphaerae bacterium]HOK95138.1 hypothetical protein [Anaerohalosphaeraceae bacterium]HOL30718.1 hypothetical protein [Anaerohalosphaeraceae bacterium]HOM75150.1 hypothetical protein [Anaerohalosphaeraceae bacterium]HPC63459.1 hypothetical protein [Anaerohalosphaeraceae bacterium]